MVYLTVSLIGWYISKLEWFAQGERKRFKIICVVSYRQDSTIKTEKDERVELYFVRMFSKHPHCKKTVYEHFLIALVETNDIFG